MRNAQSGRQAGLPMDVPLIQEVDRRIAAYQQAREALMALGPPPAYVKVIARAAKVRARRGWKKGRAKHGAGDEVIYGVIRAGADTMKAIAAEAKVKPYVARSAVKRLIAVKRVKAEGATSTRRYVVGKS